MRVTPADGNIFATLGFPDAEELEAKAELVIQITQIIEERGPKQVEAAEILGVDQPKVSRLVRGRLDGSAPQLFLPVFTNAAVNTRRTSSLRHSGQAGFDFS
jgi:predicted XRE-type DNA-binding protein